MIKKIDKNLIELLIALTMIFSFSIWEHMPNIIPNHYSDITSVFWREGIGQGVHAIPYINFIFEYPVIVGMLVYLCSFIARSFTSSFSLAMVYYTFLMDIILYLFTIGTIIIVYKIVVFINGDKSRIWKYFLIMPSFIMFVVYNWDIIAVFFTVLSLYFFLIEKKFKAAVAIGLGVASKVYPALLLPVYMLEVKNWRERFALILIALGTFIILNAPFIALNFNGWLQTWLYHASWGIEDSWLIFFFNQMDPKAHYVALAVLIYLIYKALLETSKKFYSFKNERVIERSFLMKLAWLFGNYVVTPQMALMLLPFYVLIPFLPAALIYLSEVLNALIIVLWFTPELNLGNPLVASSPVQWISAFRQIIWLTLFIYVIFREKTRFLIKKLFERVKS
ncbi:MAG: glycosyltransferase 87 family protein [Candidatus Bathyarchaeia archaeon]